MTSQQIQPTVDGQAVTRLRRQPGIAGEPQRQADRQSLIGVEPVVVLLPESNRRGARIET